MIGTLQWRLAARGAFIAALLTVGSAVTQAPPIDDARLPIAGSFGVSGVVAEETMGCNNCREHTETVQCEQGGCHVTMHDFGPLPGCWDGQDCKDCNSGVHGGCHQADQTGSCDLHTSACAGNFGALQEDILAAVSANDLQSLVAIVTAENVDFSDDTFTIVVRSACDESLVATLPVTRELGIKLARAMHGHAA